MGMSNSVFPIGALPGRYTSKASKPAFVAARTSVADLKKLRHT